MTTAWSSYQNAVLAEVESGKGNLVVESLAGSGKSTTLEEAARRYLQAHPNDRALVVAFNKRIETAFSARVKAWDWSLASRCMVKTLHSLGYAAVRKVVRGARVESKREGDLLFAAAKSRGEAPPKGEVRAACLKLIAWCKNTLQEPSSATAYQCGAASRVNGDLGKIITLASDVLTDSQNVRGEVSFDDMVWLPNVLDLRAGNFDVVFVDETQDLCPAQVELALRAVRKGGRIVAVGDSHQAIYAFRGAGLDTLARLVERLAAKVLPLSICYRCPTRVIDEARRYVPAIEAAPGAAKGTVRVAGPTALDAAQPGDFVLSRTNAPLMPLALAALRRGVPAVVSGRDVGQAIKGRIEKAQAEVGDDAADIAGWIARWVELEVEKATRADADEAAVELIRDTAETVMAILDGCALAAEALARCDKLFQDVDRLDGRVTFSTVHKAKGLEARRVFVLVDTLRPERGEEEKNIAYVAVTRALEELVYVSSTEKQQDSLDRPVTAMIADEIARGAAPAVATGTVVSALIAMEA